MKEEERQRQMDFIPESQAQFAVNMQQLQESQAQLTATVSRVSVKVDRTADSVNALLATSEIHEREITENVDKLVEAQIQTEENIKNLTAVVDEYFKRQDGKS